MCDLIFLKNFKLIRNNFKKLIFTGSVYAELAEDNYIWLFLPTKSSRRNIGEHIADLEWFLKSTHFIFNFLSLQHSASYAKVRKKHLAEKNTLEDSLLETFEDIFEINKF